MEDSNIQNLNEETTCSAEYLNGKYPSSFEASRNSKVVQKAPSEKLTKACSVRLSPLDIDVKSILNMEDRGLSPSSSSRDSADQQKRDSESFADGPVTKKHKNEDIIFLEADNKTLNTKPACQDVTVIKVKSGVQSKESGAVGGSGGGVGVGGQKEKEKKASVDLSPESKSKASTLQRTGSFDSSRKVEKDQKMSKPPSSLNSSSSSASSTCTLDKTDRTSLHCLEQKLKDLQKASAQTKTKQQSGEILSSKPKSLSPSGMKPSKDHHRRKEDFITERKKCNSSPKKQLKKSNSLPQVKENKMGNLFCPTTDAKVTILPINKPKDLEHRPQSTSNSVTITKISSGDSLSVPSKDIKKVFSPKSKVSPDSSKNKFSLKTFSKSDKHRDKSDKTHKEHKHRDKEHRSRESSSSKHSSAACIKCNDQFSTKEAKKLHTCNSILDAHYLIDERDRQKTSPTSSVSNSEASSGSLSRSSSRSSSPGIPGGVASKKPNDTPPKIKLSVKNDSSDISKVKISLKKDESDDKVKKLGGSGPKRDSPKEKWVESKNNYKSDQHLSERDRTSGITIEPVNNDDLLKQLGKNNGDCRKDGKEDLSLISNRVDHEFSFSGKRTYSPSMSETISVDGKESPRETNSKDSPASQADSGVFSIASSASPSKGDGGLNSDVRSPDSPSRVPCLDSSAPQWAKTSGPGFPSPASMSSYNEGCLPQGLQIPNNLSITRVVNQMSGPYPSHTTVSANSNKTMNIIANAPWMNNMGPNAPHMPPHFFSASMLDEMAKKKRGRPKKGNFDGFPVKKGQKNKEDDKDMYDFEPEEDESKPVQPLRPRRQNAQPANYKDPDSDEDGKSRLAPAPMIHSTQGFRQVQEKAMGLTQVDGFGHNPSLQDTAAEEGQQQPQQQQQEGEEKDEKNVSYTCSEIEETPKGGIKLKIKIKKSASPAPPDPEPPLKKPKTESFDGLESMEKEEPSIMSTMNEMQRLASGLGRPSPSSDYQMSPSPLKSPHPNLNSPNSPHAISRMMKPGIPGGGEPRNQTPPHMAHHGHHQMMRPNGQTNNPMPVVSNSPRNMEEASRLPYPKVNNPFAMQNNYPNQGPQQNNSNNFEMQQQQQHQQQQQQQQHQQQAQHHQNFPQGNFGDYNNYNMGYNNYMDPQQQQMYNRQQYEQHMASFRPGVPHPQRPAGPNMNMRPGFMSQGMMNQPRFQQHHQMQGMDQMSRMGNMPRMGGMHPNMSQMNHPNHPNMMRPMMGGNHGYPATNTLSHDNANNRMNSSSVMPPSISPSNMHPSRSPQMNERQLFQSNQYRMSSPQYQGHSSYSNSPTYPATPNPQGYPQPPTPGAYPQPHTPGGYQKPPTPQGIGNPPTPQSSIQNPLTPGQYPNPSTPGSSYPNPSTPVSYQNPLTPQPQESPSQAVIHQNPNNGGSSFSQPKSESVIQATSVQNIFKDSPKMTPMLSPPSSVLTSDLRKIRRPSKSVTPGTVSPNQPREIKTEPESLLEPKKEPQSPAAAPVKIEPVAVKEEKPPAPPPPPPRTPEPPKEPKWGDEETDGGLPDKVLKRIFSFVCFSEGCLPFLPVAMRTCKVWCRVARDPNLWTHANLGNRIKEKARTEKNLDWILKNKFPNALEVDVCNWRAAISAPALKIIAASCPKLIGLGLSQCVKLSHEDVRIIPSLFPDLQKIDISCVAPTTASSRSAASSSCLSDLITAIGEKLSHFNMSNNKMAGLPFVFKAISQHAKNLVALDVSNISTTSRDTILINIEKIQKGCPKLRKLRTTNTMLGLNDVPVREQMTSPGFPFLEELTIGVDQRGYFDGMDDGQIERILKKSDKLKVLDIRGCKGISDSTLVRLPCWDIEYLYVSGCSVTSSSKDGLELLVKKWCRTLKDLDIGNTTDNKTVDWAVMALVENEEYLRLRKLNLSGTGVSLKSLTKLLQACQTLESLNLTSCRALPRGMKRMYHNKEDVDSLTQDINDGKFDPKDAGSDDDD